MDERSLVYKLVGFIPRGRITTYGSIAGLLDIRSPRIVGRILHGNKDPLKFPCHRVVHQDGSLALSYAFGGYNKQRDLLIEEGVAMEWGRASIKKSGWSPSMLFKRFFILLKQYGEPGPWPWFSKGAVSNKEEISIGAILTQNTNWRNVEYAIVNLKNAGMCSINGIYNLGLAEIDTLKSLIRPSGFYNQKAERLFRFCEFIFLGYKKLNNFARLPVNTARKLLLEISGIGQETADTILLYALNKPIFVVDEFTRRFLLSLGFRDLSYSAVQKLFMSNLPRGVKLYQDYHALIVRWGKKKIGGRVKNNSTRFL